MKPRLLSSDPEILLIEDFLTEDENRHLLALAEGRFQSSRVTCSDPRGCITDYRTSSSAFLARDFVTNGVSLKAVTLAGMDGSCEAEQLQVVKYTLGQEFKGHVDCVDPRTLEGRRELAKYSGKNRSATFLAYLNEGFSGGATYFPKIGMRVTPKRNAAVFWRNMKSDGSIDSRTFHGGEALLSGTKYAVNIWLRGGRYLGKARALGHLGEVSTIAKDAALLKKHGVAIERAPYSLEGTTSLKKTLQEMGRMIREARLSPAMRSFAEHVVKAAGYPSREQITDREAAKVFLAYVRENVRYRPDPDMTEYVLAAPVTLCIPGAPMCIPVGDCFPEGTLLLRDDYSFVPVEQIKVGERIWGRDKWTVVKGKASKGKLWVDAIEMNNGSTMHLTPDHKVYVGRCKHNLTTCPSCYLGKRQESFDRVKVSDLQEGEALLQPDRIDFGSKSPDPDRMYIEGMALADGWTDGKRFCISGRDGKRKEKQKHEVATICKKIGIETSWHPRYIRINDPEWATHIAELGSRARFKALETIGLSEASAEAALRGLMADSTANSNTASGGRTYSTTSHKMLLQARVLHRMFGISTSVKMLTPKQHGGVGRHPLWRLGVRASGTRADKTLGVRSIERHVEKVPCWDIQTEDHYVYLPEHDVTVSNCDDLTVALASLMAAYGMQVKLLKQDWGNDQEHVLVIFLDTSTSNGIGNGGSTWLPADPSSPDKPVGWKMGGAKEIVIDPADPKTLDLVDHPVAEYIGVGRLPVALGRRGHLGRLERLGQVPTPATSSSISKAYNDLYNEVTLPIVNADALLAAGEYSDAITAYQAAANVAVNTVGPEIGAMDTTGATANYFAVAVALQTQLAAISASGSAGSSSVPLTSAESPDLTTSTATQQDGENAQALAKQILTMYQISLETVTATSSANKQTDRGTIGAGDLAVGGAVVAAVTGVIWGLARRANAPRMSLRARRSSR